MKQLLFALLFTFSSLAMTPEETSPSRVPSLFHLTRPAVFHALVKRADNLTQISPEQMNRLQAFRGFIPDTTFKRLKDRAYSQPQQAMAHVSKVRLPLPDDLWCDAHLEKTIFFRPAVLMALQTALKKYPEDVVLQDCVPKSIRELIKIRVHWEQMYPISTQNTLTLYEHKNYITSVQYSPNGTQLASAGYSNIKLWNPRTGKETFTLHGHKYGIYPICYNPDGTQLVSGSPDDKAVKFWDPQIGTITGALYDEGFVQTIRYSPDGSQIASGYTGKIPVSRHDTICNFIKLWDQRTKQGTHKLHGHSDSVYSVDYHLDTIHLASGSEDKTIKIWDLRVNKALFTLEGHTTPVWAVRYNPDGTQLASVAFDNSIKLWNTNTATEMLTLYGNNNDHFLSIDFNPDGTQLASGSRDHGIIKLWNPKVAIEPYQLPGHRTGVESVCYSPDGTQLASGSRASITHGGTLKLWNPKMARRVYPLNLHRLNE